ncbi:MAG: class I SAM-dependent methyltransferase [Wenzhouxiangella sp.]|jgi:SAM-dependent methyltransferase|nr:class I SAM-dependent methyltransferase [Wenzhouxiangella sp.]
MPEVCRACAADALEPVADLGRQPLVDSLAPTRRAALESPRFPLRLTLCARCGLLQLLETPPPERLFGSDFPYYSSQIPSLVEHARRLADRLIVDQTLDGDSRVLELASNDGYLLQHFHARGIPVLGIDPAAGPVAAARARGIETVQGFFDETMAGELAGEGLRADVIIASNVLAHVPDPADVLRGVARLLSPDGTVVIEVGWARALLEQGSFDTVYHEHHCYFSARALQVLFARAGLIIRAIEPIAAQGGSLRIHAGHSALAASNLQGLIDLETRSGVFDPDRWRSLDAGRAEFAERVRSLLDKETRRGNRCAAYGAAAKGAMLLNLTGLGGDQLLWVADVSPHKQGLFLPGSGLEVVAPARIGRDRPERLLLLAWNWKEEIAAQQADWLGRGGRFILPVARPRLWP